MMTERFPLIESLARRLPLPWTVDPVAKELYGVTNFVLKAEEARGQLAQQLRRGLPLESAEWAAAKAILEARVERLAGLFNDQ